MILQKEAFYWSWLKDLLSIEALQTFGTSKASVSSTQKDTCVVGSNQNSYKTVGWEWPKNASKIMSNQSNLKLW